MLNRAVAGDEPGQVGRSCLGKICISGSGVYMLAKGRGVLLKGVT